MVVKFHVKLAHMASFLLHLRSQLFLIAFSFFHLFSACHGYLLVAVIIFGFCNQEEVFVHLSCLFTRANVWPNNSAISFPCINEPSRQHVEFSGFCLKRIIIMTQPLHMH